MLYILRAGIKVPIPPSVAAEGGEAIQAYVASRPADRFPPVPPSLLEDGAGKAHDAYLSELAAAGVLTPLQAAEDAAFAREELQRAEASASAAAAVAAPTVAEDPAIAAARALAQQTIARLATPATVTTVVTPPPAVHFPPAPVAADDEE